MMMKVIFKLLQTLGAWFWSKLGQKDRHISDLLVPVLLVAIAAESVALYRGYERSRKVESTSKALAKTVSSIGTVPEKVAVKTQNGTVEGRVAVPNRLTQRNIKDRFSNEIAPVRSIGVKAKDITGVEKVATDTHDTVQAKAEDNAFGGMEIHYADKFATINVEIDSVRESFIDYSIRDSLVIISFQKKHSLLFGLIKWRENKKVEVHSLNPKTTISGFEVVHKIE